MVLVCFGSWTYPEAGKAPVQTQAQLQPAEAPQVMLGDLGLHCTAWNQATWVPPPQKAMEVMSTAPMSQPPMEKRPAAGRTSPAMQFAPEAMRFLQPGSPVAASMSPTPTAGTPFCLHNTLADLT
eukprot:g19731.t1